MLIIIDKVISYNIAIFADNSESDASNSSNSPIFNILYTQTIHIVIFHLWEKEAYSKWTLRFLDHFVKIES